MARRLRIKCPGHAGAYHIVSRTNGQEMRLDSYIKSIIINKMTELQALFYSSVISYAILDNHVHILINLQDPEEIDPREAIQRWNTYHEKDYRRNANLESDRQYVVHALTDISRYMKKLNLLITRAYNRHTGKEGGLWQNRFHSTIFERGISVLQGAAYIELNSFRASLVKRPEEYKYCSLHHLKEGNTNGLIDIDFLEEELCINRLQKKLTDRRAFTKELYKTYLSYVYEAGSKPKGGKEHGTIITKAMKTRLKKYGIAGQAGNLFKKNWDYSKSIFVGGPDFTERFYDEHINPGYIGSRREEHMQKWLHTSSQNLCSIFSIFHQGLPPDRVEKLAARDGP